MRSKKAESNPSLGANTKYLKELEAYRKYLNERDDTEYYKQHYITWFTFSPPNRHRKILEIYPLKFTEDSASGLGGCFPGSVGLFLLEERTEDWVFQYFPDFNDYIMRTFYAEKGTPRRYVPKLSEDSLVDIWNAPHPIASSLIYKVNKRIEADQKFFHEDFTEEEHHYLFYLNEGWGPYRYRLRLLGNDDSTWALNFDTEKRAREVMDFYIESEPLNLYKDFFPCFRWAFTN